MWGAMVAVPDLHRLATGLGSHESLPSLRQQQEAHLKLGAGGEGKLVRLCHRQQR